MNGKKPISAYFSSLWNRIVLPTRLRNKWKWVARVRVKACQGFGCHYWSDPDYHFNWDSQ